MCYSTPVEVGEQLLDAASLLPPAGQTQSWAWQYALSLLSYFTTTPHHNPRFNELTGKTCIHAGLKLLSTAMTQTMTSGFLRNS